MTFPSLPSSGGSDPARPHSSTGSNHLLGRPVGEWTEEQDREAAARYFVNKAADIALRQSIGSLCKPKLCTVCGITFLAMSDRDDVCHVDVGR